MKLSNVRNRLGRAAVAAVLACWAAAPAHADLADRDKAANIQYDHTKGDDLNQVYYFSGNVIVTKGTIVIHSDELVVKTDPEGYQSATAISTSGNPVTFRQHREGPGDQFIEGHAERIEYSGKTNVVKLFDHAVVKRLQPNVDPDEMRGDMIEYNSDTEKYAVTGGPSNITPGGTDGRGRTILQPAKTAPKPPGPPLPLKSAPTPSKTLDE